MTKDTFEPKQNRRIGKKLQNLKGDGDVWVERSATDPRGKPRSYFQSVKTNRCVWDEPPSGASRIILKSELHRYPALDLDKKKKKAQDATTTPSKIKRTRLEK